MDRGGFGFQSWAARSDRVPKMLRRVATYFVLAPYDHEQADLLVRLSKEKRLEELPVYK